MISLYLRASYEKEQQKSLQCTQLFQQKQKPMGLRSEKPNREEEEKMQKAQTKNMQFRDILFERSQGLPNVGNSCFLNSVIQLLYSVEEFKKQLIKKYEKSQNKESPSYNLGKIFMMLEAEVDSDEEKRKSLVKILQFLPQKNMFYKMYKQEGILETFNNILLNLDYSLDQRNRYEQLFEIQCQKICQTCLTQPFISTTLFSSKEPEKCMKCMQQFKTKYLKWPKYMLFYSQRNTQSKREINLKFKYTLLGETMYSGNGYFGHYVCKTIRKGVEYIINDGLVRHSSWEEEMQFWQLLQEEEEPSENVFGKQKQWKINQLIASLQEKLTKNFGSFRYWPKQVKQWFQEKIKNLKQ